MRIFNSIIVTTPAPEIPGSNQIHSTIAYPGLWAKGDIKLKFINNNLTVSTGKLIRDEIDQS